MLLYEYLSSLSETEIKVLLNKMSFKLSTLRAHFYVISFTKNDLRMSVISTTSNNIECML